MKLLTENGNGSSLERQCEKTENEDGNRSLWLLEDARMTQVRAVTIEAVRAAVGEAQLADH